MHYMYSVWQKIAEYKYRYQKNNGYVLMFHEISDNASDWNCENISMRYTSFRNFIDEIQKLSIKILPINNLLMENRSKGVYITFDDIYSSAFINAIQYMEYSQLPYSCFIATGLIGTSGYLSNDEFKFLAHSKLCTIGGHTCSHRRLRSISNDEKMIEFIQSKQILESKCNKKIEFLAYPYGSKSACPSICAKLAKQAGYSMAFSTYSMPLNKKYIDKNKYFMPRINVNENNYNKILKIIKEGFV